MTDNPKCSKVDSWLIKIKRRRKESNKNTRKRLFLLACLIPFISYDAHLLIFHTSF